MTRLYADPPPLQTWGPDEAPEGFVWGDASHRILEITNHWIIDTLWWEPEQAVSRHYCKIITDTGFLCHIFHDRLKGGWYLSRVFD